MKSPLHLLLLPLLLLASLAGTRSWAQAGATAMVSGTVQSENGDPLVGVAVLIICPSAGFRRITTTDISGGFTVNALPSGGPYVLQATQPGFRTQVVDGIFLKPDNAASLAFTMTAGVVVVAASRVEESIGQVPVTVEKIERGQVEQLTTPDLVAGLGRFKGIDVSSSSLLTASFSTRGFNSSRSERVIQLADYMDTQLPSLSTNVGNLLGTPVLDVASVEIVHGPASALYGANAFNGVLLTNSKDPFRDPGLTVRLRGGSREMLDGQLRYATNIGERVAFKISGGATVANDFVADNQAATSTLIEPGNNAAGSNLGYDAVSRYGDIGNTFTSGPLAGKTVFLPGFSEADLVADGNKTHSYKVAPSLTVLINKDLRATLDYKYTQATTTYQNASRYRFVNSGAHQGRAQLEGRDWFLRAFTTQDFSGGRDPGTDGGYNLSFLGGFLQAQQAMAKDANGNFTIPMVDANGNPVSYAQRYFKTYATIYNAAFTGNNADAAALMARNEANTSAPLLTPGSPEFNAARRQIIHDPTPGKGARVVLRSVLSEGSGQYTYRNTFADLTIGGAYRQFLLGSDGSLFADTKDGGRIRNYEFGAYAQGSKALLDDHLKLSLAGRLDRFQNFGTAFSPRASAVYSLGATKEHNFRASYNRAFRSPAQSEQYIRFDVGQAIALGNVSSGFQGYALQNIAGQSFASQLPGILAPSRSADLAGYEYSAPSLKLEEVNSYEVGYRAQLAEKLYVDADYFYNTYNNFIATQNFIGNVDGSRPTASQIGAAALGRFQNSALPTRVIRIAANVDQQVKSQGAGLTLSYAFAPALTASGNYSYNELITKDFSAGTQSFFNTPRHKFNLGLGGQLLDRALSYNVNYRWVDSFLYESTFATGTVPTAYTVDAQVGYALKPLHTTLQIGATNLFDSPNLQVYGAPSYGRIGYFGLLFNIK